MCGSVCARFMRLLLKLFLVLWSPASINTFSSSSYAAAFIYCHSGNGGGSGNSSFRRFYSDLQQQQLMRHSRRPTTTTIEWGSGWIVSYCLPATPSQLTLLFPSSSFPSYSHAIADRINRIRVNEISPEETRTNNSSKTKFRRRYLIFLKSEKLYLPRMARPISIGK